jgi:hypothetical protein
MLARYKLLYDVEWPRNVTESRVAELMVCIRIWGLMFTYYCGLRHVWFSLNAHYSLPCGLVSFGGDHVVYLDETTRIYSFCLLLSWAPVKHKSCWIPQQGHKLQLTVFCVSPSPLVNSAINTPYPKMGVRPARKAHFVVLWVMTSCSLVGG